ncbi:MAG: NAD-dependent succinate-semialdehyde dehydrogenase [Gemmatimonadetes bacterium]|nr:NAD-dependent succinate-semialdehyde dehydrogenase [Gemmatimonadota bacterium]
MPHVAVDPSTGRELYRVASTPLDEARLAAARAHAAHRAWWEAGFSVRGRHLRALAEGLRSSRDALARRMAGEMGKPIVEGLGEVEKCAWVCDYYAEHAEAFLAPEHADTAALRSGWVHRPLGVVLGIMPWNFPLWQVLRFAAPTLMAGNGVLIKHAPSVPGCAEDIQRLIDDAGLPTGLVATLFLEVDEVDDLIADRHVAAVTLTGSVRAGRAVASAAGRALKKTVLELGGSDASVVLADADVPSAAAECVRARMLNGGQSCIAAKRMVVVDALHDAFVDAVVADMRSRRSGDPHLPDTTLGPLARVDLRDALHDQVERSAAAGAVVRLGGEIPAGPGAWYPPTVLTEVGPGMPAYDEELFGPVAAVIRARDDDDAIRVANDTAFGLGASVYTSDLERGEAIARDRLHAGACFVNGMVRSDPRLPFGGVGISGYGRELSALGIREFVNVKTVWVEAAE